MKCSTVLSSYINLVIASCGTKNLMLCVGEIQVNPQI